jgi:hypothetical protein
MNWWNKGSRRFTATLAATCDLLPSPPSLNLSPDATPVGFSRATVSPFPVKNFVLALGEFLPYDCHPPPPNYNAPCACVDSTATLYCHHWRRLIALSPHSFARQWSSISNTLHVSTSVCSLPEKVLRSTSPGRNARGGGEQAHTWTATPAGSLLTCVSSHLPPRQLRHTR